MDIDPSEAGRTGGERRTPEARETQERMRADADRVHDELRTLGVTTTGGRAQWFTKAELPRIIGDRDVIAFHAETRRCVVAEVEGDSSGQPEQKLYKAIGQIVLAAGECGLDGWQVRLAVVVFGGKIAKHLERARALEKIGVCGLLLSGNPEGDRWVFGQRWES